MLLFDMGVQLSFLAVGTLVTIHTPFTGKASKATVDLPVNSSDKRITDSRKVSPAHL